jgi:RimJ/RimL family protein N-acetyltransferase
MTRALAALLPDLPRWVEARDLLLGGACDVFGLRETPELSCLVRDASTESVFVIGSPDFEAIRASVRANVRGGEVIAPLSEEARIAEALPGWRAGRILVHLLGDAPRLPSLQGHEVRFLRAADVGRLDAPADIVDELTSAAENSPVAATFVEQRAVSFCYAASTTETLWDISIDTLPEFQRHGHAALCVTRVIEHMRTLAKEPVWCSVQTNVPSWRLAAKLGFVVVDELVIFESPALRAVGHS